MKFNKKDVATLLAGMLFYLTVNFIMQRNFLFILTGAFCILCCCLSLGYSFNLLGKLTVKKEVLIVLNEYDYQFLKELQHELNTQENDGNADPVFWGVAETTREYGFDEQYCTDGGTIHNSAHEFTYDDDELDAAKESLIESEICTEEELQGIKDIYELAEFLIQEKELDGYEITYYRQNEHQVTNETGCFITKRACNKHIKLNGYHYKKGHTYAMTAWRNPEFERLIKIIKQLDFEEEK